MHQKIVRRLEQEIEEAIAELVSHMKPRELPLQPSKQTMHLMAKAAVTVYESAFENQERSQ